MLKKTLTIMGIAGAFYAQAQDISIIRNSIDAYSASPIIGSAKLNAMGGANGALGGESSSLLTNPAGLGVAISGEISGTLSLSNYRNTAVLGNSSNGYGKSQLHLGNIGGVMTFQLLPDTKWKFINIGVNFSNQSLDNYIETPGNSNIITPDNRYFSGHIYNRTGNLSKMSIGVGANYNHSIYIGAGVNFLNASIDQGDTAVFNSVANNSSNVYNKNETPFSERSSGFSASLGIIGKVSSSVRLGAALESPVFWSIDRGYDFYNDPEYGNGRGFESRSFTSPLKATLSAAFVPSKNFSMDVDYTLGLTKPKYIVNSGVDTEINNFFKDFYKNLSEVRIGAEYRVKQVRVRGGYSYASSPIDQLTISQFANDGSILKGQSHRNLILSSRNTLSFGLGYDFGSFYIDGSYQNISSKYANPFMYGSFEPEKGINAAYYGNDKTRLDSDSYIVSDVKSNRNNFYLTFGWKF